MAAASGQHGSAGFKPTPVDSKRREEIAEPEPHGLALNTLGEHYTEYFATPEQLRWYALTATDKARNIMDLAQHVPHASILDVGAGEGAVLNLLDQAGFGERLCAVDISPSGLDGLRAKSWKRLEDARLFDGYAIPHPDNSFDLALLSHVLEHVEHPRLLLREAARVARHIYIEVPLEYHAHNRRLKRDFELDATGHINFYNPTLIRLFVQSTELRVLRQEVRHFSREIYTHRAGRRGLLNFWIKRTALRLNEGLATKLFNYHCALLCTREPSPQEQRGHRTQA